MSDYIPLTWSNEVPQTTPVRYTLRDSEGNIIYDDVTIDLKTVITEGTPINAANMNHIEQGISNLQTLVNEKMPLVTMTNRLTNAAWVGDVAKDNGLYTLNAHDFNSGCPAAARAILLYIASSWTGVSNSNRLTVATPGLTGYAARLRSQVATIFDDRVAIVKLDASGNFSLNVEGNPRVVLEISGYWL